MKPLTKLLNRYYFYSVLWGLLISYLCFVRKVPFQDKIPEIFGIDKLVHLSLYAIWYVIMCFEASDSQKISTVKNVIIICTLALFGGMVEILQQNYFPPRTGDWFDFLADVVGIAIGIQVFNWYLKKKTKPI